MKTTFRSEAKTGQRFEFGADWTRKPSFLRNQLRYAVHMIVLAWIECGQGAGRTLGRGVPVYRSTGIGRRLYDAGALRGG